MPKLLRLSPLAALLLLGACATIPNGPSVMALPGSGRNFDQFRADDADCRQFALGQIGGASANDAAIASGVTSAAIGAGIGALAGAAMGGHENAGAGAAMGLLAGSAIGAGSGQDSGYASQRRYDHAYIQCMYAKGDRVPVSGQLTQGSARSYRDNGPPPAGYAPPPPSGSYTPPPPPPGYAPPPGVAR